MTKLAHLAFVSLENCGAILQRISHCIFWSGDPAECDPATTGGLGDSGEVPGGGEAGPRGSESCCEEGESQGEEPASAPGDSASEEGSCREAVACRRGGLRCGEWRLATQAERCAELGEGSGQECDFDDRCLEGRWPSGLACRMLWWQPAHVGQLWQGHCYCMHVPGPVCLVVYIRQGACCQWGICEMFLTPASALAREGAAAAAAGTGEAAAAASSWKRS